MRKLGEFGKKADDCMGAVVCASGTRATGAAEKIWRAWFQTARKPVEYLGERFWQYHQS